MNSQEYHSLQEAYMNVYQEVDEAVYGGEQKKPEAPKDKRLVVTNADRIGNTQAYQKFKKGDPRYKAADHMGEETRELDEVRGGGKIDAVSDIPSIRERGSRSPKDAGLQMSPLKRAELRAAALKTRGTPEATKRANRINSRFVNPTNSAVNRSLLAATNARSAEKRRLMNPQESYNPDLFDVILEYLITEGYADTNENALVIMANMSEDWRQSIVEVTGGGKVEYKPRFGGSSERPGPRVYPQTTQDPEKRGMSSYPSTKTADKINQLNYQKSKIPTESEKRKKLETRVSKLQSRFNRDGKEDQDYVSK